MDKEEHYNQVKVLRDQENDFKQKSDNLLYLILGVCLGVVGGYLSTWIYNITRGGLSFHYIDLFFIFIFIFIVIFIILTYKFLNRKSNTKALTATRKIFEKNRVIITDPKKFEDYKKQLNTQNPNN